MCVVRPSPVMDSESFFHSKQLKYYHRLTEAVIQLEREIVKQKEELSSSSTELRIMIRYACFVSFLAHQ